MKKKIFVMGMSALALMFVMGLTGCTTVDQQTLKKDGVPENQRAALYVIMFEDELRMIDGVKQGWWGNLYTGRIGTLKEQPKINSKELTIKRTAQLSAGEHTITISGKLIVGRKNYEGTFNFEAGKNYLVQLVTPTMYEMMMKPGFDGFFTDLAAHLKEGLTGNQIVVIAESAKSSPTFPDRNIRSNQWIRSKTLGGPIVSETEE